MTPRLVVLGLGGLGCPAALGLAEASARAQVPLELVLVDPDVVELSNLPRQFLYRDQDVGLPKVHAARAALARLIPRALLRFELHQARFDVATAPGLLAGATVLLDGTDDVPTRFLANDLACEHGLALVHGAAVEWTGQVLTVRPGETACLRCLFEGPPPRGAVPACAEAGVLAPLTALIGAHMASEAWGLVSAGRTRAAGTLLRFDAWAGRTRPLAVPRDPGCSCGRRDR